MLVPVPPGTKGRDCDVQIDRKHLRVGVKGQPPVVNGALFAAVKPEECAWTISDNKMVEVTLCKQEGMCWWATVIEGDEEIDVQKVLVYLCVCGGGGVGYDVGCCRISVASCVMYAHT